MDDKADLCEGTAALTAEDRARIVARIHSLLFWVGEAIPQEIRLEDRTVPLRDVVYRYIVNPEPSPEERKNAEVLAEMLDREAGKLEAEIHRNDLSRKEACELMDEARSLLRAVEELRNATGDDVSIKRHDLMKRVEDAQRWRRFVDRVE
jgi:hypothetical protein